MHSPLQHQPIDVRAVLLVQRGEAGEAARPAVAAAQGFHQFRDVLLLRAQLARIQMIGSDSSSWWLPRMAFLRGEVQWANTRVVGAEQFGLGCHGTVRGYAERLFMGDRGACGTLEFRTPINVWSLFTSVPGNPYRASERFQLVYFVDVGYFLLDEKTEDESEFIYSVGLGLRYSWEDLALRFDWGVPIDPDDKDAISTAGAGHVSLQYQF